MKSWKQRKGEERKRESKKERKPERKKEGKKERNKKRKKETSLSHQMRFGDLHAHLSRVLISELSFKWYSFMFLVLFCFILVNKSDFSEVQLERDRRTDGLTEGRTDGRTDTPSYKDATAHLKKQE